MRPSRLVRALAVAGVALLSTTPACTLEDKSEDKGLVDDSLPPGGDPARSGAGKADGEDNVVPISVESAHPYANNFDRVYTVDLATLPSCANAARLHFKVLRTEAGYDSVTVEGLVDPSQRQSFDGNHDDTWTEWFAVPRANDGARALAVRLVTDASVRRHGFEIDGVQWSGSAVCPLFPIQPCPEGSIRVNPPPGVCECDGQSQCTGIGNVEISHSTSQGRMNSGKRLVGTTAFSLGLGPDDGIEATAIGTVGADAVAQLVGEAIAAGVVHGVGYDDRDQLGEVNEYLVITIGNVHVEYSARLGAHSPEVATVIAGFEALFTCGQDAAVGALVCGDGYSCDAGACIAADGCFCPAVYQPVCGVDGRTYSNGCAAGCADVEVGHAGVCGIAGDMCGGQLGLPCSDDHRCRYDVSTFEAPYPDAAGGCVPRTYCDAAADCLGLLAPTVLGAWSCPSNACTWQAGPLWHALAGSSFETAHPYGNGESVWKAITLPAEAQAMRLKASGTFDLEDAYDYLEVWTWQGGAWQRVKRYTGTVAPSPSDEFVGLYHYLRFVSDPSVRRQGFRVAAEYR